jgi:raffinose/stachyose/melibiose transport system permease protein
MMHNRKNLILVEVFGVLLGLLFLSPFYILVVNAFKTKRELLVNTLALPEIVILDNFPVAFSKMGYMRAFINSLSITTISLLIIVFFSAAAAWVLVRTKTKVSNMIFFMFVGAMLIPFQSVMLPLVQVMGSFEIGGNKFMLNNPFGMSFMYLGFGCSLAIFLYHGFIKGIPLELEEAAIIDGCTKPQVFWHIVLPLLNPISVTVAILNSIWIWNDYLLPSLMLQKREARTIPLQVSYFFGTFSADWHLAMAALTISIIPVIVFYLFMQRYIIKGVTAGAIKF